MSIHTEKNAQMRPTQRGNNLNNHRIAILTHYQMDTKLIVCLFVVTLGQIHIFLPSASWKREAATQSSCCQFLQNADWQGG